MRDTDADWVRLGEVDPYFGVVTDPQYHADALDAGALDRFYATGRNDVAGIVRMITRVAGAPGSTVLDVGCGVGRLTEAMADLGHRVTGYDISPGMLERARGRSAGRIAYVDRMPDARFDWVNSFIVLQHIPPRRGLDLIEAMAASVARGGVICLQLPFSEDAVETVGPTLEERLANAPIGLIAMYTYDLNAVLDRLWDKDIRHLSLEQVQHGSYRGFFIIGRRA